MAKKTAIVRRNRKRSAANKVEYRRRSKILSDKQVKGRILSSRDNSAGLKVIS
jgi:hypothetical protein